MSIYRCSVWMFRIFVLMSILYPACAPKEDPQKKECTFTSDCKDGATACKSGKCVPISCKSKEDCRPGWNCDAAKSACVKGPAVECREDLDCLNNKICNKEGQCVVKAECEKDADCKDASKPVCKEQKCIPTPPECEKDADCKDSSKPLCKGQKCVEKGPECQKDEDCTDSTKPRCISNKCTPDTRAKEGEACELGKTNCQTGLVCLRPDPKKANGTCQKSCQPFSSKPCEGDKVCKQTEGNMGACVDPNSGKKEGEDCSKVVCEKNLYCVDWKGKKVCSKPCDAASNNCELEQECFKVSKVIQVCVAKREPCGPGRPCAQQEYQCVSGLCTPPPACDQIKCQDDEVCENRACRKKKCPTEIQCKAPEKCSAKGICEKPSAAKDPPCVPCKADGTCATAGALCLGGGGLNPDPNKRYCIEDCGTSGSCTDSKNFTCTGINVTSGNCTSNTQCRSPATCQSGKCTQTLKLCMPTIGTCINKCKGVSCNAPTVCVPTTGSCVKTGKQLCETCSDKMECGGTNDLCLSYPNSAGRFCGKDCSSSGCPTGYSCFTVGGTHRQCAKTNFKCP